MNPILETNPFILVMNLHSIDPLVVFRQTELKVGLKLLQIIGKPFEEFRMEYKEILELIQEMDETKRIDFLEEMEDYIFQSRWFDRLTNRSICLRRRLWENKK